MNIFNKIQLKNCILISIGSFILAFGLYNIHSISSITEGGVLGLTLLLDHHFSISPAISGAILNILFFAIGWKVLGPLFLVYSGISTIFFSLSYKICECFPHIWPSLSQMPLLASILGGIFVGIGAGLGVKYGGASGGDDALAMTLCKLFRINIEKVYIVFDLTVLIMSLSYIPASKILYSILTVILSGKIIGYIQRYDVDITKEI